jgi:hypothetical protein
MKMKLSILRNLLLVGIGATTLFAYNNCGKGQTAESLSSSSGIDMSSALYNAADICSEEEINVFARGYHQFLKDTCKNCHVAGPGKGSFASPEIQSAFNGFSMLGYDKISQYAVNNSHNPPYTGSQNLEIVNSMRIQWQTFQRDRTSCGDGSTSTVNSPTVFSPEFETTVQDIQKVNSTTSVVNINGVQTPVTTYDRRVLTWNLGNSLASLQGKAIPNLNGAQLSVTVTGFVIPTGQTAYLITLPTLRVGQNSLRVKGLNFRLNGFRVGYATTFKKIDMYAYKDSTVLLGPGSLVSVGPLGSNDTLSVQIGDIEIVSMDAPPPPPSVQFKVAEVTILPTNLGYANKVRFEVEVLGNNIEALSVPVNFASAGQYQAGETPATGLLGNNGQNRFDWDYRLAIGSTTSLNFKPDQKTASFEIVFSDDERFDVDKVLRVSLGTPLGATLAPISSLKVNLPNYNAEYTGGAPTFNLLMKSTSVLGKHCVQCHNSVQKQGGYDMTDYEDMKTRGIIIPGDLVGNNHKMFRRMNADAPNLEQLQSMPLNGFRPRSEVDLVNQWILDGARNN